MTIVLKYNLFLQADNSVSTGVEKVTRITVHCKLTKNFWQRQIQQVLATNEIEWNKEQMIHRLCTDAPEMSMEEAWYPRPKLPPKGKKVKCFWIDFVEDYKILHLESNLPGRDVRGRRRVCPRNLWGSPCLCGPSSHTCSGWFVMMMMVVMVVVVWF